MCKDVSSLSILASRMNPRIKVLDYMLECQAQSSGEFSLVDSSVGLVLSFFISVGYGYLTTCLFLIQVYIPCKNHHT